MTTNHMDYPKAEIQLKSAFNLDLDERMKIEGMAPGHPLAPRLDQDYVFEMDLFRDVLTFWVLGLKAMKLSGAPSTGKTSVVEQWHARLGLPLFIVPCHESMTDADILGQYVPTQNGTLKWVDSPVLKVHRYGGSVLLDESNNMNPNAASIMNSMLEGYAITIPQTGEVIKQHPNARFFCTQNPVDGKVQVQGRYVQDTATDDRFMEVTVNYLEPELEQKIIVNALRRLDKSSTEEALKMTAIGLVKVGNAVRRAFLNNDQPEFYEIHKPFSTRAIKRWALLAYGYRGVTTEAPALYALKRAVSGMSAAMQKQVYEIAKAELGL